MPRDQRIDAERDLRRRHTAAFQICEQVPQPIHRQYGYGNVLCDSGNDSIHRQLNSLENNLFQRRQTQIVVAGHNSMTRRASVQRNAKEITLRFAHSAKARPDGAPEVMSLEVLSLEVLNPEVLNLEVLNLEVLNLEVLRLEVMSHLAVRNRV